MKTHRKATLVKTGINSPLGKSIDRWTRLEGSADVSGWEEHVTKVVIWLTLETLLCYGFQCVGP